MAQQLKVRPSDIYGIADPFAAYCFDRATTTWGTTVEQAVQQKIESAKTTAAKKRAVKSVMDAYLYCDGPTNMPGRFRDPMKM